MTISINATWKYIWQNSIPIYIKNSQQTGNRKEVSLTMWVYDMLISLTVVIISLCIHISNHNVVYLKYIQFFLKYIYIFKSIPS